MSKVPTYLNIKDLKNVIATYLPTYLPIYLNIKDLKNVKGTYLPSYQRPSDSFRLPSCNLLQKQSGAVSRCIRIEMLFATLPFIPGRSRYAA